LINPAFNPVAVQYQSNVQGAADSLGVELHILRASSDRDLDWAFARLRELRAGGLVIAPDVFFLSRTGHIAAEALRQAVPAAYQYREFTAAGGLISYGTNVADPFKVIGSYAGRILNGEKVALGALDCGRSGRRKCAQKGDTDNRRVFPEERLLDLLFRQVASR
jgi:putative ABC transport system substrate-binding protein